MLLRISSMAGYRNVRWAFLGMGLATLLAGFALLSSHSAGPASPGTSHSGLARLPLSFEPNAGQTDEAVRFMAHAPGGTLFFTDAGVVLSFETANAERVKQVQTQPGQPDKTRAGRSVTRIDFPGANPGTHLSGRQSLPGRTNYIKGKDRSQWHTNLPTYGGVTYSGLYTGIDLSYEGDAGQLKGTFTVAPGADPSLIRWRYEDTQSVLVDDAGNLQVALSPAPDGQAAMLTERAPVAWQTIEGKRVALSAKYNIGAGGTIGFELGRYDHGAALTIDPTIIYSTYLGGFRSDGAGSIRLDGAGNIYVGGTTSSSDFPLAGDPFQPVYGGGDYDMFASKLSPDGSSLIYSTFVGGGDWDVGGLAGVDAAGVATLGGWTTSENFPTTPGAYQGQFAGTEDVAVARLSPDGSDLIFGSYWGDEGVDESYGFAVDGAGNTYFTGYYYPGRDSWAFLAALNSNGSQQLFRRNLGGSQPGPGDENANSSGEGVVVDDSGNIYLTGYTRAADFPVTPGAYRTSIEAFEDGFVTKLSPMAQSIIYSTYIPGGVSEYPFDIDIDAAGNAYITGNTSSQDYPTTPGAFEGSCGDPRCAFVTKLNPPGSALAYSTFLGGPDFHFETEDYGLVVRVNGAGNAYVGGYTSAPDFPVVNPIQTSLNGSSDGFLTKFNLSGSGVEYSTYLGGNSGDSIGGIAFDGLGHVYLAGSSSSTDFPTVDPLQPSNHGDSDGIVAIIAEEGAVTSTPTATRTGTLPTATPTTCVPGPTGWSTEPAMSIARDYATAAVAGDKLYVIGGSQPGREPPYVEVVERFDPAAGTWDTVAPIPVAAQWMAAAAVGNRIYVAGGFTVRQGFTIDLMQIYDTTTNTWSQGTRLPARTSSAAAAAYGGKVYIFGGGESTSRNTVYEYDPVSDTYAVKAPIPTTESQIAAAVIGDKIYVVGGSRFDQYTHYVYDPVADTWASMATPLTPSFSWPGAFALNGELWVVGGYDNSTRRGYPPGQEVQIYNPATNTWRFGPVFNTPRTRSRAAGAIGQRGYVAGGADLVDDSVLLTGVESIGYGSCATSTPTAVSTPSPCTSLLPWRTETPMPIAHSGSAAAVVDNRLYIIGGASNSPTPVRYTQRFDPSSNSWTTRAPYPDGVGLAFPQAAQVGGNIYTIGDTYQPGESFIEMYDPGSDSWTRKATLPQPLLNGALASYAGKVYVIGGQVPGGYPSPNVYEYDPGSDAFTALAPMPSGQAEIGAAAIGNRIYAVGGYQYVHYVYDPASNSWSEIAAPPTPTFSFPAVFDFNGELWVIGGYDNWTRRGYPPSQEVQIYSPATNNWRYGPTLNQPRYFSTSAGVIGGRAYLAGGIDLNSNNYPYNYLDSMESITYAGCATTTPSPTSISATTTPSPTSISATTTPSPTSISATATRTSTPSPTPIGTSPAGTPTRTATPTPVNTSVTITPTRTATAPASATPCTVAFSDVHPSDYFYEAVAYLYCHGAISGYGDGTFRPFNDTTRAQLTKIAVLARGWTVDTTGGPHFTDVPTNHPFYPYIETAYNHQIISGYAGGVFQPYNIITRGQISKVVVLAMGWPINTTGGPHFSDVPTNHPFYDYVETGWHRGILFGYNDGTFRPYNNATRGQISVVVYRALSQP